MHVPFQSRTEEILLRFESQISDHVNDQRLQCKEEREQWEMETSLFSVLCVRPHACLWEYQ